MRKRISWLDPRYWFGWILLSRVMTATDAALRDLTSKVKRFTTKFE